MKPHVQRFNSAMNIKFPPRESAHGEVRTYRLPKEEVIAMYGPSPKDIFTRELYHEFLRKKLTQQEMAKEVGLEFEQVKYIIAQYRHKPKEEKPDVSINLKEKLTVEWYLKLKEQEVPDIKIRKSLNMNSKEFNKWKHENNLIGVKIKHGERITI